MKPTICREEDEQSPSWVCMVCVCHAAWYEVTKITLFHNEEESPERQATFNFGDKYCQMESSDVVKKNLSVFNRSSYWSSKVVTRCCQSCQGCILAVTLRSSDVVSTSHIGRHTRYATLSLRVVSCHCRHLVILVLIWSQSWDKQRHVICSGHQCHHLGHQWCQVG